MFVVGDREEGEVEVDGQQNKCKLPPKANDVVLATFGCNFPSELLDLTNAKIYRRRHSPKENPPSKCPENGWKMLRKCVYNLDMLPAAENSSIFYPYPFPLWRHPFAAITLQPFPFDLNVVFA